MTLIDLLTAIAFVAPIVGGAMAGWRVGVVDAAVGIFIGALIAIAGVWILRRTVRCVAESKQTWVTTFLAGVVYAAAFAWAYVGFALAAGLTTATMHGLRI